MTRYLIFVIKLATCAFSRETPFGLEKIPTRSKKTENNATAIVMNPTSANACERKNLLISSFLLPPNMNATSKDNAKQIAKIVIVIKVITSQLLMQCSIVLKCKEYWTLIDLRILQLLHISRGFDKNGSG